MSQIAGAIYRHLALGLCLILTCAPTAAVTALLAATSQNLVLFVLAQLPVAPALAAGLSAVRGWRADTTAGPFALFWRGYRGTIADVLRWWGPALLVSVVLGVNIAYAGAVAGGLTLRPVSIVIAALLLLCCGYLLVITAYFSFRTRDAVRIAVLQLFRQWRVTLGMISMLVVAVAVLYLGTAVALLVLAWAFVSLLELVARPTTVEVMDRFTTGPPPITSREGGHR